jgi:hypothetical protein
MSTLKERFINLFQHPTEEYLDHLEAEECEKIADDYAIEFANWFAGRYTEEFFYEENYTNYLLEIFKKEKGL